MACVSRPFVSFSSTTRPRGNASTVRAGTGPDFAAALTVTVAFGSNAVPGTRPVTVYVPAFATWLLSFGAGQITRTFGPAAPPL